MKVKECRKHKTEMLIYAQFLLVILMIGCSSSNNRNKSLISINLPGVIDTKQEVPLSKYVNKLEYIPLELTNESVIGRAMELVLTPDYIIVRNYANAKSLILLFDRRTGKFVRHIGEVGKGPEEYMIPSNCFFNPYNSLIYAQGAGRTSIRTYNLEGEFLESFDLPGIHESTNKSEVRRLSSIDQFLDADTFVSYVENLSGNIDERVVIFSKTKTLKSFPNFKKFVIGNHDKDYIVEYQLPVFFCWNKTISFKEKSNDTLFSVSRDGLIPRLLLNYGNFNYPYILSRNEALDEIYKPKDHFEILFAFENSRYLFFVFSFKRNEIVKGMMDTYLIVFDKITHRTVVSQNNEDHFGSFKNDIDGFLSFTPRILTDENELVGVLQASEIKLWKTKNRSKIPALIARLPWLDSIDEVDNPVIVVGKLKE
jgi:hypothetical protein